MGHVIGIDTTYTGNPVSFNAAYGGTMKSVSVPFSPTQDLHGYDNPWPAGGGKNKLNDSLKHYTGNNVYFGGATSNTGLSAVIPAGTYTFTCRYKNATGVNLYAKNIDTLTNIDGFPKYGSSSSTELSGTFTLAEETRICFWTYSPNVTSVDNVDFAIVESGLSFTSYAPYSNICPISGLTGLSVYRTGVNVWDEEWENGTFNTTTGVPINTTSTNRQIRSKNTRIPVRGGESYYFKWINNSEGSGLWTMFFDADENIITGFVPSGGYVDRSGNCCLFRNRVVEVPENAAFCKFYCTIDYGDTYNHDLAINYPATVTTYEPYNGNTYAVDWSTQAGTVYGGTVDVVTGVLTVDRASVNISSSWSWNKSNSYPGGFYVSIDNAGTGQKKNTPSMCSHAKTATSTSQYVQGTCYCDAYINIRIMDGTDTVQDWKNYINAQSTAGTPIQICYELATPVTYQLTPKQIDALIGQNYIWSSNNETLTAVLTAPATGFAGWLIKCVTNGTPVEIPLKYMRAETYTVTPDQRMEWSAERDVTGVLHRETVQNLPPKIEFNTPLMTNSDINALNSIIKAAFTNYLQRNITIQFYDPERNEYWEWDCYMPDVKYHIRNADTVNNIINYEELRYAFIGY